MSLSRKIADALDDQGGTVVTPTVLHAEDGPFQMTIRYDLASPVGLRCQSLDFVAASAANRSLDELRAWAQRLASRASYLMEPLKFVEADALANEVLLRSDGPTPRQGRRAFYELRIQSPGTVRLSRVSFDETSRRREPESFQLTREALERLVDDLVTTVG
jgi:hypothetical protein